MGIFNDQRKRGVPLTVTGDGEQRRDCVHVSDVARANLATALSPRVHEVYNVGSGKNYSINEVARLFSANVTYIAERKGEPRVTLADIGKITSQLGWRPKVAIEEAVRDMVAETA